jgi:hypothetical protein
MTTESEVCLYALITNFSGLDQADKIELQTQWQVDINETTRIRVRETVFEGVPSYTCTFKVKQGDNSCEEVETIVTPEFYHKWRKSLGVKGMAKTRYTFNARKSTITHEGESYEVPGLTFEVDVLKDNSGNNSQWCKIDLEFDKLLEVINNKGINDANLTISLDNLPFNPDKVFVSTDPSKQDTIKKFHEFFSIEP